MEDILMVKINLRNYYPFYQYNCFVEVPEEVAEALQEFDRQEDAYQRRMYRNKAQYSLDRGDGIEHDILFISLSPWEIYERKVTYEQLHAAIASLPDKQAKRVYAYYFLQMSYADIAKAECVSEAAVREGIDRGLRNIEKYLKRFY
jgi:RNA polymerase sigma-70 factor (ECF subfamily)